MSTQPSKKRSRVHALSIALIALTIAYVVSLGAAIATQQDTMIIAVVAAVTVLSAIAAVIVGGKARKAKKTTPADAPVSEAAKPTLVRPADMPSLPALEADDHYKAICLLLNATLISHDFDGAYPEWTKRMNAGWAGVGLRRKSNINDSGDYALTLNAKFVPSAEWDEYLMTHSLPTDSPTLPALPSSLGWSHAYPETDSIVVSASTPVEDTLFAVYEAANAAVEGVNARANEQRAAI